MRVGRVVAALALPLLVLAGCGGDTHTPATLAWHGSTLPAPSGSHAIVRDAAYCGSRWYVVGATGTSATDTRPAVWSSADALHWSTVPLDPAGGYYAAREVLATVACSHGRIAVVGAKPGGAHGMPRTANWEQRPDGSLVAVKSPFVLYGGVHSVQVGRMAGGPHGWLISGIRSSGAAVWRSTDGRTFHIEEGAPGLASTRSRTTQAFDAAWYDHRWWVVGTAVDGAGTEHGRSWTPAAHGHWDGLPLPSDASLATAERVAPTTDGLLAVGVEGDAFGAWRQSGGSWGSPMTFGERDHDGTEAPYVVGLAVVGDQTAVTHSDGAHFRMALGPTSGPWADVAPPASIPVSGDHQLEVVGGDGRFVLIGDDGTGGRVWVADPTAS